MKISLNINGRLMQWEKPIVMGILNLTPDSFYDGGAYSSDSLVLAQAEKMLNDGATIIDVGGFSSRPGAKMIEEEEEIKRIAASVSAICKEFNDALISIDTYRKNVAEICIDHGASMINDISGGLWDKDLPPFLSSQQIPYIIMHMQGEPESMQKSPTYEEVTKEIYLWFSKRLTYLDSLGINDIIIDPGFGFGKSLEHNYQLLKNLDHFKHLERPILVGISRKGLIQKVIDQDASSSLNGTTAAHTIALLKGANLLRVHDVKEAKEAIEIVDYYQKQ